MALAKSVKIKFVDNKFKSFWSLQSGFKFVKFNKFKFWKQKYIQDKFLKFSQLKALLAKSAGQINLT